MYQIGPFHLDPQARVLLHEGAPVALGGRAVDVLTCLVEHARQHVPKESILAAAWPGRVVEESNLNVQISAIRRALSRAPGGDGWVETLARRGYRFVGPVSRLEGPVQGIARIPASLTRFVGREKELAAMGELLARARLVTLVGIGGIGKTRLAQESARAAASRLRDGAWFVDLAPVGDPARVPAAVAARLEVQATAHRGIEEALKAHLQGRELLIVLDNCEPYAAACRDLAATLLAANPALTLLATSRVPLGVAGEQVVAVRPLSCPAPDAAPADVAASGAASLFAECARRSNADFDFAAHAKSVARICTALDGIPLALELAAAHLVSRSIDEIAGQVAQPLSVPEADALRSVFAWSYDGLSGEAQSLFRRCGVFAAGFTASAAGAMALDPASTQRALGELVARGLLVADTRGDVARFHMLETVRAYALERLAAVAEADYARQRHLEAIIQRFSHAVADWLAIGEREWRARFVPEVDDVRHALDFAWSRGRHAEAVALTASSGPLWTHLSLWTEGAERFGQALARMGPDTPSNVQASLWLWHGILNDVAPDRALPSLERAASMLAAAGDRFGLADAQGRIARTLARMGQRAAADHAMECALPLASAPLPRMRAFYHSAVAFVATQAGDLHRAHASYAVATRCFQEAGAEYATIASLGAQADVAWALGERARAAELLRETLAVLARNPMPRRNSLGYAWANLSGVLTEEGDIAGALASAREAVPHLRATGYAWIFMDHFAARLALAGRARESACLAGFTDRAYEEHKTVREPNEARARATVQASLEHSLASDVCTQLKADGGRLTFDDACELAVLG